MDEYYECDVCDVFLNPDNEDSYVFTDRGACLCRQCAREDKNEHM